MVGTLLVLPDHRVSSPSLAHPAERVVDASSYPQLCQRVRELMPQDLLPSGVRERLLDFLSNRFAVLPDVSSRIGQVGRTSTALSSGLATWVPAIGHESGLFVVEATAGSGKTQLALALMRQADRAGQRCAYVCFNRALADHMIGIAPPSAQIMTFHEACVEHARRCGTEPDWVQTMTGLLRAGGRAYLLGDPQQRIYWREDFELEHAVRIRCQENFRSPRKVVETLYRFKGQSAPAVILCEIDFGQVSDVERRKLFVGMTRAQVRLECVLSKRAARGLLAG